MSLSIHFLGASGTVTGSKYLVSADDRRILVDAGLFQGSREWREENWGEPPFALSGVDAVLLTHAHIDHTGILPRYYSGGLRCPVFCTRATRLLSEIMLPDSGFLQEEEAKWRSSHKKSRHHPPLPLYTEADARSCLSLFRDVNFGAQVEILPGIIAEWRRAGHILGAGSIRLQSKSGSILFSGDIGRYSAPILRDPEPGAGADLVLIESTYGDRLHPAEPIEDDLAAALDPVLKRGGVVLIPAFAVGRTQALLYYIRKLKLARRIPDVPVIVDSPMATDATAIYGQCPEDFDEELLELCRRGHGPFQPSKLGFVRSADESKRLNAISEPMILISASGMLSGGRVLHHLKHRVGDPRNLILFVGYQPPGGRGAWMLAGNKEMRILGENRVVRAEVKEISGLSAHGDKKELLRWAKSIEGAVGLAAVVHGEGESAHAFADSLAREVGWKTFLPNYHQEYQIA